MKKTKLKKATWRDVKQELVNFDHEALLALVQDLYQANQDNKVFLHSRLCLGKLGKDHLEPYKEIIDRYLCPDFMYDEQISISKAKKAISDYKKANGSLQGVAELSVFYCESCVDFLSTCSLDYESYYYSLASVFESSVKAVQRLENKQQSSFIERLKKIYQASFDYGYDLTTEIEERIEKYNLIEQFNDCE